MVKLNGNSITLTRGDTLEIQLALTKNEDAFTPADDDVIKFHVSINHKGEKGYVLVIDKEVSDLLIKLDPADTANLAYRNYNYDLEITYADGAVDTFVQGQFNLLKECG